MRPFSFGECGCEWLFTQVQIFHLERAKRTAQTLHPLKISHHFLIQVFFYVDPERTITGGCTDLMLCKNVAVWFWNSSWGLVFFIGHCLTFHVPGKLFLAATLNSVSLCRQSQSSDWPHGDRDVRETGSWQKGSRLKSTNNVAGNMTQWDKMEKKKNEYKYKHRTVVIIKKKTIPGQQEQKVWLSVLIAYLISVLAPLLSTSD